jgi:hypothetical protein
MIYFTWFHGSVGQTPGKMMLGLRVFQASGVKMTFGVAFLRWVGSLISGLFLWLGYLWIAVDGRKQGWHDKIAATLVARVGYEPVPGSSLDAEIYPSSDSLRTAQDRADARTTELPPLPADSASNIDHQERVQASSPPVIEEGTDPVPSAHDDPSERR